MEMMNCQLTGTAKTATGIGKKSLGITLNSHVIGRVHQREEVAHLFFSPIGYLSWFLANCFSIAWFSA